MVRLLKQFFADISGVASLKVVVWAPLCIMLGGFGLDSATGYLWHQRLQIAADTAALAAATKLPSADAARTTAKSYAERNALGVTMTDDDVIIGHWDDTTRTFTPDATPYNAVRVIVQRSTDRGTPVDTMFLSVLGVSTWDVSAQATATGGGAALTTEIALVMDTSQSLRSGGSWTQAKQALIDAIDGLDQDGEAQAQTYVSLIPFSDRVNLGTSFDHWVGDASAANNISGGADVCVRPREEASAGFQHALTDTPPTTLSFTASTTHAEPVYANSAQGLNCGSKIVAPTTNTTRIETAINGLSSGGAGRYDVGLAWGWRAVSPNWTGQWGIANYPSAQGEARKIVVFVADGQTDINRAYADGGFNEHDALPLSATAGSMSQGHAAHFVEMCTAMRDQGIQLYMLAPSNADAVLTTAMRDCAVGTSRFIQLNHEQDAWDDERDDDLEDMIDSLSMARLVE